MEKLFKFVGILLVGTAIMALIIPANPTHERTPLSVTVKETVEKAKNFDIVKTAKYDSESVDTRPKNLSSLERDIVTPKKAKTHKKLSHSELLKKIRNELGDDAVEIWMSMEYNTDYNYIPDEFWKVDDVVMPNLGTDDTHSEKLWEFREFVDKNGYEDKEGYWRFKDNKSSPSNPTLTKTATTQQQPKQLPKKDFTNTRYTEEFVKKYRLDKKYIKTDADREFDKKWYKFLQITANMLQQITYGYESQESQNEWNKLGDEVIKSYRMFVSHECKIEYEKKMEQVMYRMVKWEDTKRL